MGYRHTPFLSANALSGVPSLARISVDQGRFSSWSGNKKSSSTGQRIIAAAAAAAMILFLSFRPYFFRWPELPQPVKFHDIFRPASWVFDLDLGRSVSDAPDKRFVHILGQGRRYKEIPWRDHTYGIKNPH